MANEEIVTRFRVEESGAVTSLQRLTQEQDKLSASTAKLGFNLEQALGAPAMKNLVLMQSEAVVSTTKLKRTTDEYGLSAQATSKIIGSVFGPEIANLTNAAARSNTEFAKSIESLGNYSLVAMGTQLAFKGLSAVIDTITEASRTAPPVYRESAETLNVFDGAVQRNIASLKDHAKEVKADAIAAREAMASVVAEMTKGEYFSNKGLFERFAGRPEGLVGDVIARDIGSQTEVISRTLDRLTGKLKTDFAAGMATAILDGGIPSLAKLGELVPQLVPLVDRDALANVVNDPAVQQAMNSIKAKRATDEAEAFIAGAEQSKGQISQIVGEAVGQGAAAGMAAANGRAPLPGDTRNQKDSPGPGWIQVGKDQWAPIGSTAGISAQLSGFMATIGQIRGGDLASAPEEVQALFASLSQQGSRTHTGGSAARISPQRLAFLQNLYAGTNEDEISDFIGTLQEQRSALLSGRTGSARNATFVRESLDLQIQGLQNLQLLIEELVRQGKIQTRPEPTDLSDATINKLVTGLRTTR